MQNLSPECQWMYFLYMWKPPPKFCYHSVQVITKPNRKLKITHDIHRNGLNQKFQTNFLTNLRHDFLLPRLHLLVFSFFNVAKNMLLISTCHGRKILFMAINHKKQRISQLVFLISILALGLTIYLLTWGLFITYKNLLKLQTRSDIELCKNETIILKK